MSTEIIEFGDSNNKKIRVNETSSIREILNDLVEERFDAQHPVSLIQGRYSVKELIIAQQVARAMMGVPSSVNLILGLLEGGTGGSYADSILDDIRRLIGGDFDLGKLNVEELETFKQLLEKATI